MKHDDNIKELKQNLLDQYGIDTDRDLVRQLGLSDEDKRKMFAWIRYQCAFSYKEGYENGQRDLKEKIQECIQ